MVIPPPTPHTPHPILDEASSHTEPAGLSRMYKEWSRVNTHTPVPFRCYCVSVSVPAVLAHGAAARGAGPDPVQPRSCEPPSKAHLLHSAVNITNSWWRAS